MRDIDHKLSRSIVEAAVANNVKVIKLEHLSEAGIPSRTRRKNNTCSLHSWSFYRLKNFLEYKARLAGIKVLYINPTNTSKTCPCCGQKHTARDRQYICPCGYRQHRDVVGAINICNSTEYVGDSNIRHTA